MITDYDWFITRKVQGFYGLKREVMLLEVLAVKACEIKGGRGIYEWYLGPGPVGGIEDRNNYKL